MAWQSRGLRGSNLEELLNFTNDKYRDHGLAIIQKIPTSIKPIKLDKENRNISLAYFEKKSTVDYIGVVQGIPICFEAKETTKEALPIQNIHQHQMDFMAGFEKQQGVAFLIVFFSNYNECYFLPFKELQTHYKRIKNGGKKSIPYKSFKKEYMIKTKSGYFLHYLDILNLYLQQDSL